MARDHGMVAVAFGMAAAVFLVPAMVLAQEPASTPATSALPPPAPPVTERTLDVRAGGPEMSAGQPDPNAPVTQPAAASNARRADATATSSDIDAPAQRRSGVVFGLTAGIGTLDVSGYPNSASTLGDPSYQLSSGPVFGYGGRVFFMGALADTFNFGLWFGGMSGEGSTAKTSAQGGGFRVEAFPLYSVSPALRDLGVIAQLGVGTAKADAKKTTLSVDGTESFLGAGVLYELTRDRLVGLNATTGLTLEYQYVTSQSIASHGVLLGARVAFYGGP